MDVSKVSRVGALGSESQRLGIEKAWVLCPAMDFKNPQGCVSLTISEPLGPTAVIRLGNPIRQASSLQKEASTKMVMRESCRAGEVGIESIDRGK